MEIQEFKRVGRILKKVYQELENEALNDGVSVESEDYKLAQDVVRERVLGELGYTLEEYRLAKQEAQAEQQAQRQAPIDQLREELKSEMGAIKVPTSEEIKIIAQEVPPQVTHETRVVKETTKVVEKPTIIEKKVTEIVNEVFDPTPIYAEIGYLEDKINKIPQVEPFDPEPLKEELRGEFSENFKHNINTLGMPDFRKLSMGLQAQHDALIAGDTFFKKITSLGMLTLPKTSGYGIKVDTVSPTFGWRDLIGDVKILSPGATDPTLSVYRGNIKAFSFSNATMNEVFLYFHMPHDYVPASDIYIHTHWSQIVVDSGGAGATPGAAKWSFEVSYSKGHNQAPFSAPITTSVTQTASATQYQHMIAEVQLSAASPSASQIDSDNLEPDGIIMVRAFRDPTDPADTLNQVPFLHYVDIHYQSTGIATKQKAPNFYV